MIFKKRLNFTIKYELKGFTVVFCTWIILCFILAPLPNLTSEDIDKALAPPLSHQNQSKTSVTAYPRSTEVEKRSCSSTIGEYNRSVPVARADGSEYLASSCQYQASSSPPTPVSENYNSRDSVVPSKPTNETSSNHAGKFWFQSQVYVFTYYIGNVKIARKFKLIYRAFALNASFVSKISHVLMILLIDS